MYFYLYWLVLALSELSLLNEHLSFRFASGEAQCDLLGDGGRLYSLAFFP